MGKDFVCSRCQTSLTVPIDMFGKWVRCPQCQDSFLAAVDARRPLDLTAIVAGKLPPPRQPEPDRPVPDLPNFALQDIWQVLEQRDQQWTLTRIRWGLNVMYAGVNLGGWSLLGLVFSTLVVILVLDLWEPRWLGSGWEPDYLNLALLTGTFAGTAIYGLGTCACLFTRAPGSSRWLVGHLLCLPLFIALVFGLFKELRISRAQNWDYGTMAMSLAPLLITALAGVMCLVSYMNKLAEFLDNASLSRSSARYFLFHKCWLPALFFCLAGTILHGHAFEMALARMKHFDDEPPIAELVCWILPLLGIGVGVGTVSLVCTLRLLREAWKAVRGASVSARV